jgi:diguanylate cyclase (GGDEF)-like protein/PAS domain S-box-containing protein
LYGFGLAAIVAFALVVALSLAYLRQQSEMLAATHTQSLAQSLELMLVGKIEAVDATLLAVSDEIGHQLFSGTAPPRGIDGYLEYLRTSLPYTDAIRATNTQGDVVYGLGVQSPPNNVADRDYFIQLRDDPTLGLLVVNPLVGRIDKIWVWPFARRINKPDGSFAGVDFARMNVADVEKMLAQVKVDAGGIIALRDKDFGLIARYQFDGINKVPTGDRMLTATFREVFKANPLAGSYREDADRSIDGISRTYSYRRNPRYQFLISIGLDTDVAMAPWRKQAWIAVGLVLIFSASMLSIIWIRRRAWILEDEAAVQRDRIEVEHQAALDLLQKVARFVPGVVYQYLLRPDGSGCFPFASDAIRTIYRVTPDEVRQDASQIFANIHPEDSDTVIASIQASAHDLTRWHHEYRVKFEDGTVRWLLGDAMPQRESDGSVLWHGFITDATERRNADMDRREGHEILHSILETTLDGYWRLDLGGNLLDVNSQYCQISGYTREELLGMTVNDLSILDNAKLTTERISNLIKNGHDQFESVHRRKDGTRWNVEISTSYSNIAGGQLLVFLRDITQRKLAEADLRKSEAFKLAILNSVGSEIAVLDQQGVILAVNQPWLRFAAENACEAGKPVAHIDVGTNYLAVCQTAADLSADGAQSALEGIQRVLQGSSHTFRLEYACHSPTQQRWFTMDVLSGEIGSNGGVVIVHTDITDSKAAELALKQSGQRLRRSEAQMAAAQQISGTGSWLYNLKTNKIWGSAEGLRIFGYPAVARAFPIEEIEACISERDRVHQALLDLIGEGRAYDLEYTINPADGSQARIVHSIAKLETDEQGKPVEIVGFVQDITQRKQLEDQVRQMAFHDPLTDLPNRRLLVDRLTQAMATGKRSGRFGALIYLDLDNFKPLNDEHGHGAGDLLLKDVALRLKRCVRADDTVSRIGGDEFVVLLNGLSNDQVESSEQASKLAEKIRVALAQPYLLPSQNKIDGIEHHCTASIGVVLFSKEHKDIENILKWADVTMYRSKVEGRNRVTCMVEIRAEQRA